MKAAKVTAWKVREQGGYKMIHRANSYLDRTPVTTRRRQAKRGKISMKQS